MPSPAGAVLVTGTVRLCADRLDGGGARDRPADYGRKSGAWQRLPESDVISHAKRGESARHIEASRRAVRLSCQSAGAYQPFLNEQRVSAAEPATCYAAVSGVLHGKRASVVLSSATAVLRFQLARLKPSRSSAFARLKPSRSGFPLGFQRRARMPWRCAKALAGAQRSRAAASIGEAEQCTPSDDRQLELDGLAVPQDFQNRGGDLASAINRENCAGSEIALLLNWTMTSPGRDRRRRPPKRGSSAIPAHHVLAPTLRRAAASASRCRCSRSIRAPDLAVIRSLTTRYGGCSAPRTRSLVAAALLKMPVLMPISSPRAVDQRAAGVAGIDRRVGLDEVLVVGEADVARGRSR